MSGISPLQRSKKMLEEEGGLVAKVEKWNPWGKVRQDLFGILDLLCVNKTLTIGVQVTTLAHKQEHIDKMIASSALDILKKAGWCIELHSWRKLKKSGWTVDIEEL